MSFIRRKGICVALAATVGMLVLGDASAQPQPQGGGHDSRGRGAEWMMGPGMMGASRFGFMCNPRHAGMAEWRLARIEAELKPNDAQTAALKELRAASTKAAEIITASCASEVPARSIERMVLMEKRLETSLQAVRMVRPAFEAFYATLDDKQKTRLDATGPRGWGWANWRWRWNQ